MQLSAADACRKHSNVNESESCHRSAGCQPMYQPDSFTAEVPEDKKNFRIKKGGKIQPEIKP